MENLYIISTFGKDKVGLCKEITKIFAENNINIIDAEEIVIRGYFIMTFLVDFANKNQTEIKEIYKRLKENVKSLKIEVRIKKYKERKIRKKIVYITTIGKDKPGIIYKFSNTFSELGLNIERMKTLGRKEIALTEYRIDIGNKNLSDIRDPIYNAAKEIGVDVIIQSRNFFNRKKRIVVFDLDGTLIEKEIIDEIAKRANVEDIVKKITKDAMDGKIKFKEALKKRVELLKGMPEKILIEMAEDLELNKDTEELIYRLKELGYKIAIISGGFKIFTDKLKEKYPIDYAYANELEVKQGKLTGKIKGKIIDAKRKESIMKEIAKQEKISLNDVIAIGDGANDRFMIKGAGLGIAFNSKEILKKFSSGILKRENIAGLLYCLGDVKEF